MKLGRLAAQFPAALHDLTWYAAGGLPKPPASVAVPAVAAWGMDGNDTYGDCGVAGINHLFMSAAADTGETETFPAADQVVSYYMAYTGGQDTGVVLSQFLGYVQKNGFYGHTVAAYAPVAVSDIPTLQFAVDAYDAAYTGITVTQAMQEAFANKQPWTPDLMNSPVAGGHCVPVVGYDASYLYVVTWGAVQPVTYPAWHLMADEAWAVITGEITSAGDDGHGINLAALQADLGKLDAPAPAAPSGLLPELAAFIRVAGRDIADVVSWLDEHHI